MSYPAWELNKYWYYWSLMFSFYNSNFGKLECWVSAAQFPMIKLSGYRVTHFEKRVNTKNKYAELAGPAGQWSPPKCKWLCAVCRVSCNGFTLCAVSWIVVVWRVWRVLQTWAGSGQVITASDGPKTSMLACCSRTASASVCLLTSRLWILGQS